MANQYKTVLGIFWTATKRYPKTTVLMFVSYACGFLFQDFTFSYCMKKIVDILSVSVTTADTWREALTYLYIAFGSMIIGSVFWRLADFSIVYSQSRIMADLTNLCFETLSKHSYTFFSNSFIGSLVTKTKRFVRAFETVHDKIVFAFWFSIIKALGATVVLWWLHPVLGLMMSGWIVAYCLMLKVLLRYKLNLDLINANSDTKVTAHLADALTGILNIKMFGSRAAEKKSFGDVVHYQHETRSRAWYFNNIMDGCKFLTMVVIQFAVLYYSIWLWQLGVLSVGSIVLVQSMLFLVMSELWSFGRSLAEFTTALADAKEMAEIILLPIEVDDPEHPEIVSMKHGEVTFDNVQFAYKEGLTVLSNFSLHIPAGQRVGLVGHSGAGKSTLFKLLLRFVDIQSGSITIDNQNITAITQDDLRCSISYVPQEPVLFHRSLYQNIAYAKPEASTDQVTTAAQQAHAHDFITALPQGYETLVGERGIKLSGGERQRVAIARAMLKDAPVVLLDEATSSLDSVSEKYIQDNLETLMQGRTVLAIAHRISTISQMDRIIVMDAGAIVEDGSHQELLQKDGVYADLWNHQVDGFIE